MHPRTRRRLIGRGIDLAFLTGASALIVVGCALIFRGYL